MNTLILRAQFVDRAGRTVYAVVPVQPAPDPEAPDRQIMAEGPAIGMLRLKPGSDAKPGPEVEWFEQPPAQVVPEQAPVPGPDFLPGRVPNPEDPGPHSGGTG